MKQLTLAAVGFERYVKTTRRAAFLTEMERIVPWSALCGLIEPFYPKPGNGRPPVGVERMLRLYFLQQWFNLSDPAVEEALYDSLAMRRFVGIDLGREPVPDETTVCRFRHLLEEHDLGRQLFDEVQRHLADKGLKVATGTPSNLPAIAPDAAAMVRIKSEIDISDRSRLVTFGERAQRSVVEFADRVLAQTQNHELGNTGALLSEILGKARGLDAASLKDANFVTRLFSSVEGRLRRFKEQFDDVASQIDRITVALDRNKETLHRDIALLDELHEETKSAITQLDTHIAAGRAFAQEFRSGGLAELERTAKAQNAGSDTLLAAQTYQDAVQAVDQLEKRIFYLEQARQIGIQQLPQIRIVQSSDETLIENLQATTELTIPVWKQKMVMLLGLNRQRSALELQKTVTDATNEMMRQASEMITGDRF